MTKIANRVRETSSTTGTGTYTLAGAVTGFQSFSAIGDGKTCYYCAEDGVNWEVGIGTYTASGTTLARTTVLASSNSGSAVSWAAGTRNVFVTIPPEAVVVDPGTAGGRLTASSTLPVTITDTKSATLYYLPHVSSKVALYDGTSWRLRDIGSSGVSLVVSGLTDAHNYDIFLYDNAGTLTLEAVDWSTHAAGTSTRTTGLAQQDGAWVKSGTLTKRYLGTIRAKDDSGTVKAWDYVGFRLIWNVQNRVPVQDFASEGQNSWSESGNGTWSPANGNSTGVPWHHEFVLGLASSRGASAHSFATGTSAVPGFGITKNATSGAPSATSSSWLSPSATTENTVRAFYAEMLGIGFHYLQAIETTATATAATFIGDNGGTSYQAGMFVEGER